MEVVAESNDRRLLLSLRREHTASRLVLRSFATHYFDRSPESRHGQPRSPRYRTIFPSVACATITTPCSLYTASETPRCFAQLGRKAHNHAPSPKGNPSITIARHLPSTINHMQKRYQLYPSQLSGVQLVEEISHNSCFLDLDVNTKLASMFRDLDWPVETTAGC